ncbi:MAG: efflux RND transporter periplasmic adaptor subunit [Rhodothermales bacterium]
MRRNTLIVLGILVFVSVVTFLLIALKPEPPRRAPVVQAPLVQTVLADVRSGALQVAGNGTVRPRAQVNLSPQVAGKIVYVSPALVSGGRVQKGQLLVRIEQADFQNKLRQAEADVAQQAVGLLQAEEESQIAQEEYQRFKQREDLRQKISPYASVDDNDYAARLIGMEASSSGSATNAGADEPSSLVLREPQRLAAAAALERAEAMLEDAELSLSRTNIVAPFDGYIRNESIDVGQFVAMGQILAEIHAADEVEVVVPLSTDEAAMIPNLWTKRADNNNLVIPSDVFMQYGGQNYRWSGYVHRAEATLDPATRTINVVLRVPRPFDGGELVELPGEVDLLTSDAPPLLVGQYTSVEIKGVALQNYFVIPRRALRVDNEIWTIKNDSLVHIAPVQVLQKINEEVYILGNMDENTEIIISDLTAVTEGMRVRPNRN